MIRYILILSILVYLGHSLECYRAMRWPNSNETINYNNKTCDTFCTRAVSVDFGIGSGCALSEGKDYTAFCNNDTEEFIESSCCYTDWCNPIDPETGDSNEPQDNDTINPSPSETMVLEDSNNISSEDGDEYDASNYCNVNTKLLLLFFLSLWV